MAKQKQKNRQQSLLKHSKQLRQSASKLLKPSLRRGQATSRKELRNDFVHVFVDDQNLFWGIQNDKYDPAFRIDFGQLLIEVSKDSKGKPRPVKSAYIAGVIPDDDSFWKILSA